MYACAELFCVLTNVSNKFVFRRFPLKGGLAPSAPCLPGLCMMSVHREKFSKDQQRFIGRFGRYPRRLQLLLLGDADKTCWGFPQQWEGKRAITSPKFSRTCSGVTVSAASSYYNFHSPRKYQLGAALLAT